MAKKESLRQDTFKYVKKEADPIIKTTRRWPRLVAMIVAATLLLLSVAFVLVEKFAPTQEYIPASIVQIPSKVIAAVIQPFQGAFSWAVAEVNSYLETWKLRKTIEIEYNKLKAQNDELTYQAMRNAELEDEILRLNDMMEVYNTYRLQDPIVARVTDKETGNWFQMFTINVGEAQGVKENMAVVNADGLVGSIYKVYETSSEVISIVDSRAGIAGLIQSTRDQGMIRGTLGIEEEATCRMYYLPVDQVPRPGDTVVTSGIGFPFPKGIGIGTVRESTRYMDENKHYVVIEPFVDFKHIEEVLVLIYVPTAEDMPETANDGQVDYLPVPMDTFRPVPEVDESVSNPELGAVTPPPRATRYPGEEDEDDPSIMGVAQPTATADPDFTLAPGASPTPNPELDALLDAEREEDD